MKWSGAERKSASILGECDNNPYTIQLHLMERKQGRMVEFLTENPETCKRLCDETVIYVKFSKAS